MRYRVVQWATGAIGKTCLRAILDRPDLALVGCYVYSAGKAGLDAGEIARYPATGVQATTDIEAILALDADVVVHTPRLQNPYSTHDEDICRLLASGKNVVTTVGHHYPQAHGAERLALFEDAARRGKTTFYGAGMNPGFLLERLIVTLSGLCVDLWRVEAEEVLDVSTMPAPDFVFTVMGMGSDPTALDLQHGPLACLFDQLYCEAIANFCSRTGFDLDSVRSDHRVFPARTDLSVLAGTVTKGTVAATEWCWHGVSAGRDLVTLRVVWTLDPTMPAFAGKSHWTVRIEGKPGLDLKLDMSDPPGTGFRTRAAQYITAGPVLNSIPEVVAAPPGVYVPPVSSPFVFRG